MDHGANGVCITDLVNRKMLMFKIHCRFFFSPASFFPFLKYSVRKLNISGKRSNLTSVIIVSSKQIVAFNISYVRVKAKSLSIYIQTEPFPTVFQFSEGP